MEVAILFGQKTYATCDIEGFGSYGSSTVFLLFICKGFIGNLPKDICKLRPFFKV